MRTIFARFAAKGKSWWSLVAAITLVVAVFALAALIDGGQVVALGQVAASHLPHPGSPIGCTNQPYPCMPAAN